MDAFDYVIVGSGTAGSLLANRLSADPDNSVLLLNAAAIARLMEDALDVLSLSFNSSTVHADR